MITGETEEVREPQKSVAADRWLTRKERDELVRNLLLVEEKRGRAFHLLLTDRAWAWAARQTAPKFSNSKEGTRALEGLLRRLLPFLEAHDIPLAALFSEDPTSTPSKSTSTTIHVTPPEPTASAREVPTFLEAEIDEEEIERACLSLTGGARKKRVRLADLRRSLSGRHRDELDQMLIAMQRAGSLVLYRDDNTAALTEDDHRAAIQVGDSPRHLVILED